MKSTLTLALLIFLFTSTAIPAGSQLTCETSSGAVVTFGGALSERELWRSTYNWGELKAAIYGGMKLHAYTNKRDLDWTILTVAPGPDTYWGSTTHVVLTLKDGSRVESVDLAATDSPIERKLYTRDGGLRIAGPDLARVPSGGVLVMAGFPAGSVITEHGTYWAEVRDLVRMEVVE